MSSLKYCLITCAMAVALLACSTNRIGNSTNGNDNSTNAAQNAPPADAVETGRKLFAQNCAACHRETGTGGKMVFEGKTIDPDDLTSEKLKRISDQKIFEYILDGVPDEGMPAFKGKLKEPELREIVKFIRKELQKN